MSTASVFLPDEPATIELASRLAAALPADRRGWLVLLKGELGAGKSTLARGLIRALGHDGSVPSPTYTLVEPYDLPGGPVYHIDLYRVGSPDELHFLGFDELEQGLRLVEWPDRAPALGDAADIRIGLAYDGAARRATIDALSARGAAVTEALAPLSSS